MQFEEAVTRAQIATRLLDQALRARYTPFRLNKELDEAAYNQARNAAVTAYADLVEATHDRLREIRPEL